MTTEEAWKNLIIAAKREYRRFSPETQKMFDDLSKSGELHNNPKFIKLMDKFLRKYEFEAYTFSDGLIEYFNSAVEKYYDSLQQESDSDKGSR